MSQASHATVAAQRLPAGLHHDPGIKDAKADALIAQCDGSSHVQERSKINMDPAHTVHRKYGLVAVGYYVIKGFQSFGDDRAPPHTVVRVDLPYAVYDDERAAGFDASVRVTSEIGRSAYWTEQTQYFSWEWFGNFPNARTAKELFMKRPDASTACVRLRSMSRFELGPTDAEIDAADPSVPNPFTQEGDDGFRNVASLEREASAFRAHSQAPTESMAAAFSESPAPVRPPSAFPSEHVPRHADTAAVEELSAKVVQLEAALDATRARYDEYSAKAKEATVRYDALQKVNTSLTNEVETLKATIVRLQDGIDAAHGRTQEVRDASSKKMKVDQARIDQLEMQLHEERDRAEQGAGADARATDKNDRLHAALDELSSVRGELTAARQQGADKQVSIDRLSAEVKKLKDSEATRASKASRDAAENSRRLSSIQQQATEHQSAKDDYARAIAERDAALSAERKAEGLRAAAEDKARASAADLATVSKTAATASDRAKRAEDEETRLNAEREVSEAAVAQLTAQLSDTTRRLKQEGARSLHCAACEQASVRIAALQSERDTLMNEKNTAKTALAAKTNAFNQVTAELNSHMAEAERRDQGRKQEIDDLSRLRTNAEIKETATRRELDATVDKKADATKLLAELRTEFEEVRAKNSAAEDACEAEKNRLREEITELRDDLENAKRAAASFEAQLASQTRRVEGLRAKAKTADEKFETANAELQAAHFDKASAIDERTASENHVRILKAAVEAKEAAILVATERADRLMREAQDEADARAGAASGPNRVAELEATTDRLRKEVREARSEREAARSTTDAASREAEGLRLEVVSLRAENDVVSERASRLTTQREAAMDDLNRLKSNPPPADHSSCQRQIDDACHRENNAKMEATRVRAEADRLRAELSHERDRAARRSDTTAHAAPWASNAEPAQRRLVFVSPTKLPRPAEQAVSRGFGSAPTTAAPWPTQCRSEGAGPRPLAPTPAAPPAHTGAAAISGTPEPRSAGRPVDVGCIRELTDDGPLVRFARAAFLNHQNVASLQVPAAAYREALEALGEFSEEKSCRMWANAINESDRKEKLMTTDVFHVLAILEKTREHCAVFSELAATALNFVMFAIYMMTAGAPSPNETHAIQCILPYLQFIYSDVAEPVASRRIFEGHVVSKDTVESLKYSKPTHCSRPKIAGFVVKSLLTNASKKDAKITMNTFTKL